MKKYESTVRGVMEWANHELEHVTLNTEVKNSPTGEFLKLLYLTLITKIFNLRTLGVLKLKI